MAKGVVGVVLVIVEVRTLLLVVVADYVRGVRGNPAHLLAVWWWRLQGRLQGRLERRLERRLG